jgi:hypothetical protein
MISHRRGRSLKFSTPPSPSESGQGEEGCAKVDRPTSSCHRVVARPSFSPKWAEKRWMHDWLQWLDAAEWE